MQYKDAKNQTTTINIGRLSIKDLSIDELKRFFVYQYKITAKLKNDTCDQKKSNSIKENFMQDVLSEGKLLESNGSYRDAIKVF